ncbi:regulatory protein RecX [Balneolales bacterium ANBcel1]|nr:regulatory protein RecX [Balneolales bacterium ANBcel1]
MDDIPENLPGPCTELSVQKNNGERVSLFVNGEFIGGFHREVVAAAGVRRNSVITAALFEQLVRDDRQYKLRDQIYRWLAIRNHSSGELRKKALAKGYSAEEISRAIEKAEERGYTDDAAFARQFAEEKKRSRKWGPVKIRAALSQKGIKKQYIASALKGLFDDPSLQDDLYAASRSIRSRLLRTEKGIKRKKKLADFLIRRGFPSHVVFEQSDDLLNRLEHEER